MSTTEIIQIALVKKNMSSAELASKLGTTRQNLHAKFNRNNFSEKDLRAIAEALDCDLKILFIDKDTKEPL